MVDDGMLENVVVDHDMVENAVDDVQADDNNMLIEIDSDDEGIVEDGTGDILDGGDDDVPCMHTEIQMDVSDIGSALYCRQTSYVSIKYGSPAEQSAHLCIRCYQEYLTCASDHFGVTNHIHNHFDFHTQVPGTNVYEEEDPRCYHCQDRLTSLRLTSACCQCNFRPAIKY